MPILPTTSPRSTFPSDTHHKRRRPTYWSASIPIFLRRLFRFPQMDFEFALWQMLYLCIAPRRVYRNIYYHKQTKNQWARDDPAFVVILSFFLGVSAIAWGLVYGHGFIGILKMILFMVFIDFVVVGMVISTICWAFANRFLTHRHTLHAVEQTVEWAYAFDIFGFAYFLEIQSLPFLLHTEMFLYPVVMFLIIYFISLFGFHISANVLRLYFELLLKGFESNFLNK
ncbi:unnamed protein product [Rhizophagus irregularis]|nr:unnamed protein product [Rhizophagus irregularis]